MNAIVTEPTHGEVTISPLEDSHQALHNQLFVVKQSQSGQEKQLVLTGEELTNLSKAWLKFAFGEVVPH